MKAIGICGNFGKVSNKLDGQTVKTRTLLETLRAEFPDETIIECDTSVARKNKLAFIVQCFALMIRCNRIIVLPAQSAIKVILPLFVKMKGAFRYSLYYYVVGGWLTQAIENNSHLITAVKRCDAVFVELYSMEKQLRQIRLDNVVFMEKARNLRVVSRDEISFDTGEPHKLCIFSRMMKEKGIEDAIDAVKVVNQSLGRTAFTLDLFGQVESNYAQRFECVCRDLPPYINYKGAIDYQTASCKLATYFAMLFPTYYAGEGYANTIVDAFSSALPVIATDWKYNAEVIENGKDGLIYSGSDQQSLIDILRAVAENPSSVLTLKENAYRRAYTYIPHNAMQPLFERLKNKTCNRT